MRVSIKDIARAAGVSHSTVSRALSDSPLVNPETKTRIKRLAQEMGYSPDAMARSLVMGRTRTVGVVVTTIADPFIAEVVQGIETTAYAHGYSVILASSDANLEREMAAVEMLRSKRVDGVIVTSSRVGAIYGDHLKQFGVPVVLLNNHSEQRGPYTYSVRVDDQHGGRLATGHLIQLGHRRIAYISGGETNSTSAQRKAGYCQALSEANLAFDPALVIPGTGRAEAGEQALSPLLALSTPPTAVFCYNDMTAIGLLRAARGAGVGVPRDLAVVGFDDIPFASYVYPPLTTIAQPKFELGQQAMEMALALITRRNPSTSPPGLRATGRAGSFVSPFVYEEPFDFAQDGLRGAQGNLWAVACEEITDIVLQGRLIVRESSAGCQLPAKPQLISSWQRPALQP